MKADSGNCPSLDLKFVQPITLHSECIAQDPREEHSKPCKRGEQPQVPSASVWVGCKRSPTEGQVVDRVQCGWMGEINRVHALLHLTLGTIFI